MLGAVRLGYLAAAVLLAGCATVARDAVPETLALQAEVPDMAGVRTWGDSGAAVVTEFLQSEGPALKKKYAPYGKGRAPVSNLLALSGGADDGAFGAGLLVGWSARGDRPEFELVTGISAGALIAPFAFLGSRYDRQLAGLFVDHGGEDIYQATVIAGLFGGASVADSAPLARLIAKYVDHRMLTHIAAERAKGRLLLVGTTNLDAQRPVYWDMGKIAQSRHPDALGLFRRVLLASASLPGLFPPVHISVLAGGKTYEEMHVDGGPTRQVFFTPTDFDFRTLDKVIGRKIERRLWVIRNGKVTPEYNSVNESAIAIAARSLETLTKSQGVGDLIRMYSKTQTEGLDFNLAHIPADFTAPRPAPFDKRYMKALYERAYALGRAGYAWDKAPPGVGAATAQR